MTEPNKKRILIHIISYTYHSFRFRSQEVLALTFKFQIIQFEFYYLLLIIIFCDY